MVRKKQGLPEDSELVLCTVTKIYPHCVFVDIEDYEDKQGMINISEIAPGRIRNIHDYVKMGKKIVCKVLRVDREKGHIDLSLRRVAEGQRREKADIIKKEQRAESIVEFVAEKLKMDKYKLYDELISKTSKDFSSLNDVFEEFISNESVLKSLSIAPETYKILSEVILQRIKPPEVQIEGEMKLKSYAPDGVQLIKRIMHDVEKVDTAATLRYNGGGSYSISITKDNYKDAEKIMKSAVDLVEAEAKKFGMEFGFERIEKKQKKAEA
jgi:translation initiation factor 2 subunit 1